MAEQMRRVNHSLLDQITSNPLDPGYQMAAARRRGEAEDRRGSARPWAPRRATVTFVLLGLLLGAAAGAGVAQLRQQPLGDQGRAVLESEVERRNDVVAAIAADNERLRQEIDEAEAVALGAEGTGLAAAVERLGVLGGALPVQGPGVRVELDDAVPTDLSGEVPPEGRVHDTDLRRIINYLWAAGAEAVAVNGQRITASSYIAEAGEAIVVDSRPLARPYTVEAVGEPDALLTEVRTGAAGQYTAIIRDTYDVRVDVSGTEDLQLPGSSRSLRYALPPGAEPEPLEEQGPGS